jgi:hypothetical protein
MTPLRYVGSEQVSLGGYVKLEDIERGKAELVGRGCDPASIELVIDEDYGTDIIVMVGYIPAEAH